MKILFVFELLSRLCFFLSCLFIVLWRISLFVIASFFRNYNFPLEIRKINAIIYEIVNRRFAMQIELTNKEFRRLLDLVYIGNWVLNSTRGDDRFADYDNLESKIFAHSPALSQLWNGTVVPSQAYAEGGIHEAIAYYEDNVFYEILAEELSRRDMNYPEINEENYDEILSRMQQYMEIFQISGVDRLVLEET